MLDIQDLIRIEAVAAHGGFTRAAAALGMTQPALTRSIAAAERLVRGQLFQRGRQGAEPTALCRMILSDAPEIIQRIQDLHERLGQLRGGSGEEVAIASGPFPLESIVLPAVTAFRHSHPRVRVRIETLAWPTALARLRARLCDFAVVTAGASFEAADVSVERLPAQRLVFVVGRDHPLAVGEAPALERILAHPLVTTAHLSPRLHRALAEARGASAANPRPDLPFPAVLAESVSAWLTLVETGGCVTLTTLASAALLLQRRAISVLPVEEPWLTAQHAIVHLSSRPLPAASAAMIEDLRQANRRVASDAAVAWAQLQKPPGRSDGSA